MVDSYEQGGGYSQSAVNSYGADTPATQSPYMAQPNDHHFGQPVPVNPNDQITRPDMGNWQDSRYANHQQVAAKPEGEAAQTGELITLSDGSQVQLTEQQLDLNAQLVTSVDQHFGQGSFDAMVQFASTLSQGEQSSLERLVMSGDPAQMQKAVNYVAQKMGAGQQSVQPTAQQGYQPQAVGMSHGEFMSALQQLERQFNPGQHQYQQHYQSLVQQRAVGKRAGR